MHVRGLIVHYFKKNLGDYYKKAGRLSMLQHGAYTLLNDACYDRERFPTLDEAIDWCWASTDEEISAVEFVLRKFFTLIDGVYVQSRIKQELDKYHANSQTNKRIAIQREAAKRATRGENRVNNVNNKTVRSNISTKRARSVNEPPPNQEPLTKNQEPIDKKHMSANANVCNDIFQHWVKTMGKRKTAIFNAKRKNAVIARLREGYTPEQIKRAIVGCSKTPHNIGQNDHGRRFDDLELICRNGSNVERFAESASHSDSSDITPPSSLEFPA